MLEVVDGALRRNILLLSSRLGYTHVLLILLQRLFCQALIIDWCWSFLRILLLRVRSDLPLVAILIITQVPHWLYFSVFMCRHIDIESFKALDGLLPRYCTVIIVHLKDFIALEALLGFYFKVFLLVQYGLGASLCFLWDRCWVMLGWQHIVTNLIVDWVMFFPGEHFRECLSMGRLVPLILLRCVVIWVH